MKCLIYCTKCEPLIKLNGCEE